MFTQQGRLPVVQPFDLALSIQFFRGFSPMSGDVSIAEQSLSKSWIYHGQPVAVTIRADGDAVHYVMTSPRVLDFETERAVRSHVIAFLSADEDLAAFYEIASKDRAFAPIARRLRGFHHPRFSTPFEAACWAVINQRVQLAQARRMKAALVTVFGARGFDAFPEAHAVASANEKELARILKHDRKARAVWAVAQAFSTVKPNWLQTAPIGDVETWLHRIYGVGEFSAAFVLFRGLGRALALPWSPKFVDAAQKTYGRSADRAALEKKGAAYGPWLGHWSLYLWASTFVRGAKAHVDEGARALL